MASVPSSFFARHEFLIRRLHSLSGLIPVGAFMTAHLLTNASVLAGPQVFQKNVDAIHALGPLLPLVEWVFIFLPIIFHAAVGVVIAKSGKSNSSRYPYVSNVRYTLQRATAWIALVFIGWHVFHMHGWSHNEAWLSKVAEPAFGAQFHYEEATSTAAMALSNPIAKVLYAIGVLSCVFRLANGLWTMGITWGVWTSPAAQRRATYACTAFGLLLAIAGMGALVGMSTVDLTRARAIETVMAEERQSQAERVKREEARLREAAAEQAPSEKTTSNPNLQVR